MKVVFFDRATVTFELADQVGLGTTNSIRSWRPRPNLDEMAHMFISARAVKCSGRIGEQTCYQYWN